MSDPLAPGPGYEPTLFDGPVLPYPDGPDTRSSGWSGSATSHERAVRDDSSGATTARQQALLRYLAMRRAEGATWKEVANHFEWHHGQASGALSNLHKEGHVARLAEVRRGRCAVYVLPDYVAGRLVSEQGRQRPAGFTLTEREEAEVRRARWSLDNAAAIPHACAQVLLDALERAARGG